jgi:hypothetical protein
MSGAARKAAASKMTRAIGIKVRHKQAYIVATLVQEQFKANFANGV